MFLCFGLVGLFVSIEGGRKRKREREIDTHTYIYIDMRVIEGSL